MFKHPNGASRTARMAVACGLGISLVFGGVMAPVSAFAAPSSITIKKAGDGTYKVYKLFGGTFVEGDGGKQQLTDALANPTYKNAIIEALRVHTTVTIPDGATDAQVANTLTDAIVKVNAEGNAQKLANTLAEKLNSFSATKTADATSGTLSITGLEEGYYLIMADPTDADFSNSGLTSAILTPVYPNMPEGAAKIDVPTVDKTVKDEGEAWDKEFDASADAGLVADALSKLTYKITGTVPNNIAEFTSGVDGTHNYSMTFVDTLPTGFDTMEDELASWNVSIMCGTHDLSKAFTASVETNNVTHTSTVKWSTTDLKGALEVAGIEEVDMKNLKIEIQYTPAYDEQDLKRLFENNATLDNPQTNSVKIEFSNSPYSDGKGETPGDETKVYSYNLNLKKVDEEGANLTGAEFTLTTTDGKTAGKQIVADSNGVFTFTGLESEVEYVLTETKVPTGMKSIDPIHFVIKATKNDQGEVTNVKWEEKADPSNAATFEATGDNDAIINVDVVNLGGPDLPITGQAGILGGVAVGGLVLAVSAVAMVRNRRNEA